MFGHGPKKPLDSRGLPLRCPVKTAAGVQLAPAGRSSGALRGGGQRAAFRPVRPTAMYRSTGWCWLARTRGLPPAHFHRLLSPPFGTSRRYGRNVAATAKA